MPWVWVDGLQFHAVDTFSCSSSATSSSDTDFVPCCSQDLWIGEADNPGPVDQFENLEMDSYAPATTSFVRIGCSNAGGLRGKKVWPCKLGAESGAFLKLISLWLRKDLLVPPFHSLG